jgi:hypothetical protein
MLASGSFQVIKLTHMALDTLRVAAESGHIVKGCINLWK